MSATSAHSILSDDAIRLAPHAQLRVALNSANTFVATFAEGGGIFGIATELAEQIGRALDIPVHFERYESAGDIVTAIGDNPDAWDVAFLAPDPARTDLLHFTKPFLEIPATLAVRRSSGFCRMADVDQPGVVIASAAGTAYDLRLCRSIKSARVISAESPALAIELFESGADALAGVRGTLGNYAVDASETLLLEDDFAVMGQAVAVPLARRGAPRIIDRLLGGSVANA